MSRTDTLKQYGETLVDSSRTGLLEGVGAAHAVSYCDVVDGAGGAGGAAGVATCASRSRACSRA